MLACVRIPYFSARLVQHDFNLVGQPIALGHPFAPIAGLSPEAVTFGVQSGMLPHQAHGLCPELQIIEPRPSRDERLVQQIEESFLHVSPKFIRLHETEIHDIAWLIDLKHISENNLSEVAQKISTGIERLITFKPQIGLAKSAFTAQVASLLTEEECPTIVPSLETKTFLAPLSINYLQLTSKLVKHLGRLGIERLGQVSDAPALVWQEQFGLLGKVIYTKSTGQDRVYIPYYEPPEHRSFGHEFNNSVVHSQPVHHWITELATKLACDLQKRRKLGQRLTLQVTLEDRTQLEKTIVLRIPTAQPQTLSDIFKSLFNSFSFTAGVSNFVLEVDQLCSSQPAQLRLFEDALYQRQRLNATLQSLRMRFQAQPIQQIYLQGDTPLLQERIQRVGVS